MTQVRRLTWDDWNVLHIARHNVTPDEVEEVCHGNPMTSASYAGRLRLIGPTNAGRLLTVILAPSDDAGIYYPVTARPASKQEHRRFEETQGGRA